MYPSAYSLQKLGIIHLFGEIEEGVSESVSTAIFAINESKYSDVENIKLIINTGGGEVYSGFSIVNAMKSSALPVYTIASGQVSSMGLIVLMAGEPGHRYIFQNTIAIDHQFSTWAEGTYSDMVANKKGYDILMKLFMDFYAKHTALKSKKKINEELMKTNDRWMTPAEVVKYGIADKVISSMQEIK